MHVESVIPQINDIPALAGRVQGALELAALVRDGNLPQVMPAAFVLPLALRGIGSGEAATGVFAQAYSESVAIILVLEAPSDPTGGTALPGLTELIAAVVNTMAGFDPGDATGVFALSRGQLLSVSRGVVIYQLDFAIQDQLRIV